MIKYKNFKKYLIIMISFIIIFSLNFTIYAEEKVNINYSEDIFSLYTAEELSEMNDEEYLNLMKSYGYEEVASTTIDVDDIPQNPMQRSVDYHSGIWQIEITVMSSTRADHTILYTWRFTPIFKGINSDTVQGIYTSTRLTAPFNVTISKDDSISPLIFPIQIRRLGTVVLPYAGSSCTYTFEGTVKAHNKIINHCFGSNTYVVGKNIEVIKG